jgi:hypothetical protein
MVCFLSFLSLPLPSSIPLSSFFFFLVALEFELRALCLLGGSLPLESQT